MRRKEHKSKKNHRVFLLASMYVESGIVLGDVSCFDVEFATHRPEIYQHCMLLGDFYSGDKYTVLALNVIIDFFDA